MTTQDKDFTYFLTSEIDFTLRIKILTLTGNLKEKSIVDILNDPYSKYSFLNKTTEIPELYITCQLYSDNKPILLPIQTAYTSFNSHWIWNQWLEIPIKYKNLPLNSQIKFTIWKPYSSYKSIPVGGSTFRLFSKNNVLKTGKHRLLVHPDTEGDGMDNSKTLSKSEIPTKMDKLNKLLRKYDRGDIPKNEWLDILTFKKVDNLLLEECKDSPNLYMNIDLPQFDFPVLYNEKKYTIPTSVSFVSKTHQIVKIVDSESFRKNLVEEKHRKLVRGHCLNIDIKPNANIRDELQKILKYPPTHILSSEEKNLLWKFRNYLTRDKKAVTKFLKCVMWSDANEAKQAVDLLVKWNDIDVEDALELLGKDFQNVNVRRYAVLQLKKANDVDLQLYLLQLVQALKFENIEKEQEIESTLADFLIQRSINNPILGNSFYWYLVVGVEYEQKDYSKMYGKIIYQFLTALSEIPEGQQRKEIFERQGKLIDKLKYISNEIRMSKETRAKKIEMLRTYISDPKNGLADINPLPLLIDSTIEVVGIIPEKSTVFSSSLMPLRLTFRCVDGSEYPVMFKNGDDLRQDQLVMQIITLMDQLLKKENLDLKLTPYKVLPTGFNHGLIQFVPNSYSLATIISDYNNSIQTFLKQFNPDDTSPGTYNIKASAMDTYIKSCAGYCVISYLLGVGDRHLDNLLMTTSGNIFHVDFGYILGRDPKPFPPPMKLCKEMVEAMGGASSPHYQYFRSFCFSTFSILRKNSNLILNLFGLMVDANIRDIAIEPDKAVMKVQERFQVNLPEEQANQFFKNLIEESVNALFPQMIEKIHQWAQYWRK
ncbi:phosphatidylinositol 3-kinase [Neocallimastix californiae]|jgi:phosphatidylinositol 3-kinase|uniref:Phosphatidylinositol 3-kinase VPS34 n=1 Tax=Neocallimastix californiae TaxID=1754190 RepID=A0A1Y2C1I7_9FUNG|nr:phosphatidylinositol 3-kinase [Neocallimastix californiae]|eukprot:ORY40889.1 phosphatidylinositol 3-kinase [Neocallimastix californiae]